MTKSITLTIDSLPDDIPVELVREAAERAVRKLIQPQPVPRVRLAKGGRKHPFDGPEMFDDVKGEDTAKADPEKVDFDAVMAEAFPYLAGLGQFLNASGLIAVTCDGEDCEFCDGAD